MAALLILAQLGAHLLRHPQRQVWLRQVRSRRRARSELSVMAVVYHLLDQATAVHEGIDRRLPAVPNRQLTVLLLGVLTRTPQVLNHLAKPTTVSVVSDRNTKFHVGDQACVPLREERGNLLVGADRGERVEHGVGH